MLYNFVHVPKAGGTYFNEVLASVQRTIDSKYGKAFRPREGTTALNSRRRPSRRGE